MPGRGRSFNAAMRRRATVARPVAGGVPPPYCAKRAQAGRLTRAGRGDRRTPGNDAGVAPITQRGGGHVKNLTQREFLYLKDTLDTEALLVEKYAAAANSVNDPELKRLSREIEQTHRSHYQTLSNFLGGGTGGAEPGRGTGTMH